MKTLILSAGLVMSLGAARLSFSAAQTASALTGVMQNAAVKSALASAKATEPQTIEDQIRFCEIAAPPFQEETRGKELRRVFQQLGL